jgi:hypothetical protein
VSSEDLVGQRGIVTTTIPLGGLGEVRLSFRGGSQTYGAYSSNRGIAIPTGTRATAVEHFPPLTLVVSAEA